MKFLEHKIPPPVLALLAGALMWQIAGAVPPLSSLSVVKIAVLAVLYIIGTAFSLSGVIAFKRAKTTLSPMQPCETSSLVQTGVYGISRNPMYLGMAIFLIMWAVYLSSELSLLGVAAFIAYMTQFQIKPEERAMQALFGDQFSQYCQRVRRWL